MKFKLILALTFCTLLGCTKEETPLIPVEIAITSTSGILEIHYSPNRIDTLTKRQGVTSINVFINDLITIKRICPEPGPLEYNLKTPTASQLTVLLKNGDENKHLIKY